MPDRQNGDMHQKR